MAVPQVKALIYDVFGTVVDWRSSISNQFRELGERKGFKADWDALADGWRAKYRPNMDKVMRGDLPWTNLDRLHRIALDELLKEHNITGLSDAEKDEVNRFWHRLRPWPDSVPGLTRLKRKFIIGTMSNGNVALMTNMAKFGGLPWDCILGAELARAYKPDPRAYQTACDLLMLPNDQVMLVAAHQPDLRAAQKTGLRAGFIPRPLERGLKNVPDLTPDPTFDVVALDMLDLADKLGA